MLTEISLENFKGYRERVTIPIAPITLLYGPNSAGKSSVFHALLFCYEVLKNDWCDVDVSSLAPVDLGGFQNLVNKNCKDPSIRIGMRFTPSGYVETAEAYYRLARSEKLWQTSFTHTLGIVAPFGETDLSSVTVSLEVRWSQPLGKPYVSSLGISLEEPLLTLRCDELLTSASICNINFQHGFLNVDTGSDLAPLASIISNIILEREDSEGTQEIAIPVEPGPAGAKPLLGRPIKLHLFDKKISHDYEEFWHSEGESTTRTDEETAQYYSDYQKIISLNDAITEFFTQAIVGSLEELVEIISSMAAIGPMRTVPARSFAPRRKLDASRWYDGLAGWDAVHDCTDEEFARISQWMFRLRTGYTLSRNDHRGDYANCQQPPARKVVLRDLNGNEFLAPDVGIGISQLLPFVAATCLTDIGIVYVEQPELHIHPALQVELGDLLCAYVPEPSGRTETDQRTGCQILKRDERKRFILETHSEHLLLRILKRIRETTGGEIKDPQLALYPSDVAVVYVDNRQGVSSIRVLRIDEGGEFIDRWPRGFFTERSDELF